MHTSFILASTTPAPLKPAGFRVFAVIAAARERARRRRLLVALAAVLALSIALVGSLLPRGAGPRERGAQDAAQLFAAQPPYLGIACRTPNSTACGRVGVAVWMRRHVGQLVASIDRQTIALRDSTSGPARVRTYVGYVHLTTSDLRLLPHWTGNPARSLILRLRARFNGRSIERTLRLQLHPGWG